MREGQQAGGTGAIVIGAIIDVVAVGQRRGEADVIEVRADHDVLVLQDRVAAFENADHVFAVVGLALQRHFQADLFRRVELEGILLGIGAGGVEDLLRVMFLALEDAVGHGEARGDRGGAGQAGGLLQFGHLSSWVH